MHVLNFKDVVGSRDIDDVYDTLKWEVHKFDLLVMKYLGREKFEEARKRVAWDWKCRYCWK